MSSSIRCFFVEFIGSSDIARWRRTDTGEEFSHLADVPIGGMWFADWFGDSWTLQLGTGKLLIVKTPGGDWIVDSQASNCTIPDDSNQEQHHCWIIHGEPPDITVDKDGMTCGAGGGSIMTSNGKYHAFLRAGYLEEC